MTTPAADPSSSPSPSPSPAPAPAAPVAASPSPAPSPTPSSAQRPTYVPEKFWDTTKGEIIADKFTEHFNGLSSRDAERVAREQAIPAAPDKYEIKLPDGFKPPEGMQFEFKIDDPAMIEARAAAHEMKLDQSGFSRLLGIYAANKLGELQATNTARDAEMAKLGSTAPQRLEAVETWLKAKVGDKANVLVATMKQYPVASTVEAMEGIMRAFSSQGGAGVTQSGREGEQDAGKIAGYENMNFVQRRAAQMNQSLNKSAGGGGR